MACAGVVATCPAAAQGAEEDPPGRVARLGEQSGRVWLVSDDSKEWTEVGRNQPLTTGDRLATAAGARADLTLGSTTLRLDASTELEIVQLDDVRFLVKLHRGSVSARFRNAQAVAEFMLLTGEGRFRIETVGRYRFDRIDQASELTVLAGQAVFEGQRSALHVTTGQHAQFWLDAAGAPQYSLLGPLRDAFAGWIDERDRADDRVAAVRYVSPEMTGADDLERYGRWEQSAEYGPIWTPRAVAAGWAPYSTGRWAWVRPWGWTWVDDAPWGFAPFHYGRWVHHRSVWCWAPGTYVARPVYAPALVAWTGGSRAGVSINLGGRAAPVGWFPLAPREIYVPSYRSSARHVRDVNFTHVSNAASIGAAIDNRRGGTDRRDFANRRFPNAVTVAPTGVLTARQAVGPSAAQYRQDLQVRALVAAPVATPARVARLGEDRPGQPPSVAGRGDESRPDPRSGDRADLRRDAARPEFSRPGANRIGAPPPPPMLPRPIDAPPPIAIAAPPISVAAPPLAPVPRLQQPVGGGVRRPEAAPPQGLPMQRPPTPDRSRALDEHRDSGRDGGRDGGREPRGERIR